MSEKYLAKYVLVLLVVSKYFYLFPSSCFYLNEKICTGCVFNSAFFSCTCQRGFDFFI